MVRVGPDRYEESLGKPHVRPMDFTAKPMTGYVYVAPPGRRTEPSLWAWVTLAIYGAAGAKSLHCTQTRGVRPIGAAPEAQRTVRLSPIDLHEPGVDL